MSDQIYNEGRVVGLSAYEIYVRYLLSQYPDEKIPSERDWLAASLGKGSSMILKIVNGTKAGWHDYSLPSGSALLSSGVLTASVFNGEVELDSSNLWATRVTDYGPLISNTSTLKPSEDGSVVPSQLGDKGDSEQFESKKASNLSSDSASILNYMKIIDGIYIHPGTWGKFNRTTTEGEKRSLQPPEMDFKPNISSSERGKLRLYIVEDISSDVLILFTGFVNRTILLNLITSDSGSTNTDHPENGDFLGPQEFPWSSKIIFTVPSEARYILDSRKFIRSLPQSSDTSTKSITATPVIDFDNLDLSKYYNKYASYSDSNSPLVKLNVDELNHTGDSVSAIMCYDCGKHVDIQIGDDSEDYRQHIFILSESASYLENVILSEEGIEMQFQGGPLGSQQTVMISCDPKIYSSGYIWKHKQYACVTASIYMEELSMIQETVNLLDVFSKFQFADGSGPTGSEYMISAVIFKPALKPSVDRYDSYRYPPVLYGKQFKSSGNNTPVYPLDVAAPGTVKMFYGEGSDPNSTEEAKLAINYPKIYPGTFSIYKHTYNSGDRKGETEIYFIDKSTTVISKPASTRVYTKYPNYVSGSRYESIVTSQGKTVRSISLQKEDGSLLGLDSSGSVIKLHPESDGSATLLTWPTLLRALANNSPIDVLGKALSYILKNNTINLGAPNKAGDSSNIEHKLAVNDLQCKSPYIEIGSGENVKRLYICSTTPQDSEIPEGSIWIGG